MCNTPYILSSNRMGICVLDANKMLIINYPAETILVFKQ